MLDIKGRIVRFNSYMEELSGYSLDEVQGKDWFTTFLFAKDHKRIRDLFQKAVGDIQTRGNVNSIVTKDGSKCQIEWYDKTLKDADENVTGLLAIGLDITERKRAEDQLNAVIHNSPIPTAVGGSDGSIIIFNKALENLIGYKSSEFNDVTEWANKLYPNQEYRDFVWKNISQALEGKKQDCTEFTITCKDQSSKVIDFKTSFSQDGLIIQMIDITERKQAEKQIEASLKEKEILLQEIHHRVKNNMQVLSSLLKLQASNVGDERVTDALLECRGRVQAMAFIHETLYGSDTLAIIDFKTYISKVANQIFQSYGTSMDRVKLEVDVEDIKLGIKQATPLGLIVNELVFNSLKHAFPQDRTRQTKLWEPPGNAKRLPMIISIDLRSINENEFELKVSDNGIGILEDLDWRNTNSLGLRLVIILADQLDGTVSLDREKGTHFTVRFRYEKHQ